MLPQRLGQALFLGLADAFPALGVPLTEMPPQTHWQRQRRKREELLDDIRKQVEKGTLVIRKMTAEERRANPPRAARADNRRRS